MVFGLALVFRQPLQRIDRRAPPATIEIALEEAAPLAQGSLVAAQREEATADRGLVLFEMGDHAFAREDARWLIAVDAPCHEQGRPWLAGIPAADLTVKDWQNY